MRRVLAFLSAAFVRLLYATLRVRHIDVEKIERLPKYVLAFWHEHLIMMLHARYRRPIRVMVSRSRDGELIASAISHYDAEVARGSTTRGGMAALRELIRAARSGSNIVFTPDGPKGPRRIAKEGIVLAAQATGLPIMPVAFSAKKKS